MLQQMKFTPVVAARSGRILWKTASTRLSLRDRLGGALVRMDIGRNAYRVDSGLYAVGAPHRDSPVLVTANYKLTFDSLRKELSGISAWILVLDTNGVNVWCAAGKGTFGTEELVARIKSSGLASVVAHRDLILPQLGASGVAGHLVAARTGFRVRFGPVYARDIPAFLRSGMRKTEEMHRVRFTLADRLLVAPVEMMHSLRFIPAALALAALFSLPADARFAERFAINALILAGAIPIGTILFPVLLPVLPFRAFSAKGSVLGLLWCAASIAFSARGQIALSPVPIAFAVTENLLRFLPAALIAVPLVAYLSMNFTGSSTFTCQKGAELEVRKSILPMALSVAAGLGLGILGILTSMVTGG